MNIVTEIEKLAIALFNYTEKVIKTKPIQDYLKTLAGKEDFPCIERLISGK